MRYAAQNDAIPVPFTLPLDVTKLREGLSRASPRTVRLRDRRELRHRIRARAGAAAHRRPWSSRPATAVESGVDGQADCSFDGLHDMATAIIDRAKLTDVVSGPAIIEDAWSTVVVPPGWQAKPDASAICS